MVTLNLNELNQIESGASKKKIYRFKNENTKNILVDFSYSFSDYLSFINVHQFLSNVNISIPKIFDTNHNEKLILMEDFGNDRYDKIITNYDVRQLLVNAIDSLIAIQDYDKPLIADGFKEYNYLNFKDEIIEFVDFYLPLLKTSSDQMEEFLQIWTSEFNKLNFHWNSFVHKDFELSNLMYLPNKVSHLKCGILDFQNAGGFKEYNYLNFKAELIEFVDFYLPLLKTSSDQMEEFLQIWTSEFNKLNFHWNSFVHKDFELSNLMYLPNKVSHLKCGILDFQNAFIGFSGWDLFSLLENPRIDFEDKYNQELIEYFYYKSDQKISYKDFLMQYFFLNTARQTRIIGRWVSLDKKNNNNYYQSNFHSVTIKRLKNSLYNLQNKQLSHLYKKILKNEKF